LIYILSVKVQAKKEKLEEGSFKFNGILPDNYWSKLIIEGPRRVVEEKEEG